MLWAGLVTFAGTARPDSASVPFDHLTTGFALTGAHIGVSCESCHRDGVFRGTPRDCSLCHAGTGSRALTAKPANHVPSSNRCEDCHTAASWSAVRFDHSSVTGSCVACHNGSRATGKPANHVPASNACQDCHSTVAWSPARFDHSGVTGGCATCHNGSRATGKPATHLPTSNSCEDCHSTTAWSPARFDHTGVTAACATCHNGSTAPGKPANHLPTSNSCADCHTTVAWTPARFDHSAVTGSCATCHNGTTATGKPTSHFVTSRDCVECHGTTTWTPSIFRHSSPAYPSGHSATLSCQSCHLSNSESNAWRFPSYRPDCAGCHASDFQADHHVKVESPRTLYTVSELRDCTGACHLYTDSSLTRIKESRTGQHSASRREW